MALAAVADGQRRAARILAEVLRWAAAPHPAHSGAAVSDARFTQCPELVEQVLEFCGLCAALTRCAPTCSAWAAAGQRVYAGAVAWATSRVEGLPLPVIAGAIPQPQPQPFGSELHCAAHFAESADGREHLQLAVSGKGGLSTATLDLTQLALVPYDDTEQGDVGRPGEYETPAAWARGEDAVCCTGDAALYTNGQQCGVLRPDGGSGQWQSCSAPAGYTTDGVAAADGNRCAWLLHRAGPPGRRFTGGEDGSSRVLLLDTGPGGGSSVGRLGRDAALAGRLWVTPGGSFLVAGMATVLQADRDGMPLTVMLPTGDSGGVSRLEAWRLPDQLPRGAEPLLPHVGVWQGFGILGEWIHPWGTVIGARCNRELLIIDLERGSARRLVLAASSCHHLSFGDGVIVGISGPAGSCGAHLAVWDLGSGVVLRRVPLSRLFAPCCALHCCAAPLWAGTRLDAVGRRAESASTQTGGCPVVLSGTWQGGLRLWRRRGGSPAPSGGVVALLWVSPDLPGAGSHSHTAAIRLHSGPREHGSESGSGSRCGSGSSSSPRSALSGSEQGSEEGSESVETALVSPLSPPPPPVPPPV
eukprot:TRINITY_DN12650_c0_g1_i1.p1 TRINITY_DN12650_c0_g1~~TRINITY_DN12650_c0_g1_i1.p1  ORF type:complete len:585 (+),score=89.24 TRINITY_DN12650_c0_g1_i1:103-1857(+)